MKFMLMIMTNEQAEAALAPPDLDHIIAGHVAFSRELHAAGKWVGSARLRFSEEATTIRLLGDTPLAIDGPFAESKEVLGGFYLIEAESKREAIEWAKKLPLREVGAVEVRPARTGAQWRGPIRASQKFMVMFIGNGNKV